MSAAETEARAAAWLAHRDRDDWCEADQASLNAWLDESILHKVAYWRLETAWAVTERFSALRIPERPEIALSPRQRMRPMVVGVASALIGVVLVGFGAAGFFKPVVHVYATALGERRIVEFADGSQIELNTDTQLRAEIGPTRRKVWLDRGEAYFQIKHDASNPFVVIAGDRYVTDLGTKFRIRRDSDHFEMALLEGRAQLESSGARTPQKPIVLVPGDRAVATGDSISLTRLPTRSLAQELAWRRGMIVFNNTALASAANEFNRYNSEKIVVADQAAGRSTIYGTFQTNNVMAFVRLAHEVLGLHVEQRGEDIVISR
jgi:transmembrane sensor